MLSPPPAKTAANENDESDAASSSITVSGVTGRALGGVVRFLYSDTLPDFDEMDTNQVNSSSSSSSSHASSDELPLGLSAAFELMVAARTLSSADAPAMQHLQALCERHIVKRLDLSNVILLLARAGGARCFPLQRACLEYLADNKVTPRRVSS